MSLPETVSAIAAAISAIGGAAAALAAFRSADSARAALRATQQAEHRASLREIATSSSSAMIEADRVRSRARDLDTEYQVSMVYSGSYSHSGLQELRNASLAKAARTTELTKQAEVFAVEHHKLDLAPPEELDRVQLGIAAALTELRSIREDLEREFSAVAARNAVERERRATTR